MFQVDEILNEFARGLLALQRVVSSFREQPKMCFHNTRVPVRLGYARAARPDTAAFYARQIRDAASLRGSLAGLVAER